MRPDTLSHHGIRASAGLCTGQGAESIEPWKAASYISATTDLSCSLVKTP